MCCFNRTEIYTLNPHVDVILKLEGVSGDRLDTSAMGTCMLESPASLLNTNHFCQAHVGCKNLLLFGSARRQPLSGTFTYDGIGLQVESEDDGANEQLAVIHILVSFCIMISLAIYLLIYQRLLESDLGSALLLRLSTDLAFCRGITTPLDGIGRTSAATWQICTMKYLSTTSESLTT
jgi:hypothetical protein